MNFRYIKVALFLSITLLSWGVTGQQLSTAPDPTLESPYNTIYVHLYYLQNDSYQPEIAAAVIPPGPDSATAVELAIEIKQILDSDHISLMAQVDALIEKACVQGGTDNISVILARVIGRE